MATKKHDTGNAVHASDPAYLGASTDSVGYSGVGQQPLSSPDAPGADVEAAQAEHQARMSKGVGHQGFTTDGTHPTERQTAQQKRQAEDELVRQANIKSAQEFLAEDASEPDDDDADADAEGGEATGEAPATLPV